MTTFGERSLAMNIWFSRIWWFDDEECSNFEAFSSFEPLEIYGFASPNEAVRFAIPGDTVFLRTLSESVLYLEIKK